MLDPAGFDAPYQGVPPPFGPAPDWLVPVAFALLPVFMALLVAAAAAMIVRYRRAADPVLRAQLRWFALAAAFLPLTLLLCWTSYVLLGDADLVMFGLALTLLALPTATAIALLRHDLYDVDRAVSAAATYGLVSTALLAVFTTVTVVAGALLGRDSAIVAAIATGVSAVALAPLRTRLQRRVDARLYPLRQAVRAELARLRTRIDDGRARPEDLEDTLRRALRDPELRVGYVLPGRPGLVDLASAPLPVGEGRQVPVHVGDTPVGALLPVRTEASRELLREIAVGRRADRRGDPLPAGAHRGAARGGRQPRADPARGLPGAPTAGARPARRRPAAARLARHGRPAGAAPPRRPRLRRERAARPGRRRAQHRGRRAARHRPAACARSTSTPGSAPPSARSPRRLPIPVALELDEEEVPDDVATTAYYVASEALANVIKHADAETVAVSVARQGGHVHVRISDDGCGGAQPRPGSGLAGLVDRVAAAGGRLSVAGRGTARGSRRCCRAHGDRRGLRPVPRGAGAAPRRRGPRDRRRGRGRRRAHGRRAQDPARPGRGRHPHAAAPRRRRRAAPPATSAPTTPTWGSCCCPSTSRPARRST